MVASGSVRAPLDPTTVFFPTARSMQLVELLALKTPSIQALHFFASFSTKLLPSPPINWHGAASAPVLEEAPIPPLLQGFGGMEGGGTGPAVPGGA